MTDRYITVWRNPAPGNLDWEHYVSEDRKEAERVVENIKAQGVHQFWTYAIGLRLPDLSSEY